MSKLPAPGFSRLKAPGFAKPSVAAAAQSMFYMILYDVYLYFLLGLKKEYIYS